MHFLFHDTVLIHFYIFLLTGIFAGCVDTISGGGGLIVVPVMLTLGFNPVMAFGTVKLQGAIGEAAAMRHFHKHGKLNLKFIWPGFVFVLFGASAGAILVQYIHPVLLSKLIPFLLLAIFIYLLISPRPHAEDIHPRMSRLAYLILFGLLIGFYNGFFGPGTGSFWVFSLMFFLGFNIQRATIHGKPLNMVGNVVSLVWFILAGKVAYFAAISLGIGQIFGARLGAHLVITKGAKLIKPLFILVVLVMTISLFVKYYFLH